MKLGAPAPLQQALAIVSWPFGAKDFDIYAQFDAKVNPACERAKDPHAWHGLDLALSPAELNQWNTFANRLTGEKRGR